MIQWPYGVAEPFVLGIISSKLIGTLSARFQEALSPAKY
jgi:hypothetical protein